MPEVNGPDNAGFDQPPTDASIHQPIAGDTSDDDGQAIDDYFEPTPGGPVDYSGLAYDTASLPQVDRILSRTIAGQSEPVQYFPADPSRKKLVISVNGEDQQVQIGSDKTDCYGAAIIYGAPVGGAVASNYLDLGAYTGAIWVRSVAGTAPISVWCVTE